MFTWKVKAGTTEIVEGDWGRDIINGIGVINIDYISLLDKTTKILVFPKVGMIRTLGSDYISLGINIDGYPYRFEDECFFELLMMAPFTTAEYSMDTKRSNDLDRHLFLKYKVTHLVDKGTRKKTKLPVPVIKSFCIRCAQETGISIC